MSRSPLETLANAIASLPDPRSNQGISHPYHGMLALVLLGILAGSHISDDGPKNIGTIYAIHWDFSQCETCRRPGRAPQTLQMPKKGSTIPLCSSSDSL